MIFKITIIGLIAGVIGTAVAAGTFMAIFGVK